MGLVETARTQANDFPSLEVPATFETPFPADVWERLGKSGLLGVSVPHAFSGGGNPASSLFQAGEALVDGGCTLGVALSWLVHNLTARYVLADHGGEALREELLQAVATGASTIALAVSEPDMHGSPKKLSATAVKTDGGVEISGRKVYITNGPMADWFAVIAVEREDDSGRKTFGAYLVAKDTPGLTVKSMDAGALYPAPHAQLFLEKCFVPSRYRLPVEGDAFTHLVKPFGTFERVLILGPTLGAMKRLLSGLVEHLATKPRQSEDVAEKLGQLVLLCDEVEVLGMEAARVVEEEAGRLSPLPSCMAAWAACRSFVERYMALIDQSGYGADLKLSGELHDMDKLCRLAESAQRSGFIRLGRNLIGQGA